MDAEWKARQSAVAGISRDIIGEPQDRVASMRHFPEHEDEGDEFTINRKINLDRLPAVPPPPGRDGRSRG